MLKNKLITILGEEKKHEADIIIREFFIDDSSTAKCVRIAKKRAKDKPLQYLVGNVEFLGVNIRCNRNVLIPRNETELLADIVVKECSAAESVLDLCCGSGCIGLAIKNHLSCEVDCCDISAKAIRECAKNARNNGLKVTAFRSNLFDKVVGCYDVIVCNPPYIKTEDISTLQVEVQKYEPHIALDGGEDGYKFYREIIAEAPKYLNKNGKMFFEIGIGQEKEIVALLKNDCKKIRVIKDYNNINRFISAEIKERK